VWCAGLLLKWLVAPWLALTPTHLRLPLGCSYTYLGGAGARGPEGGQWTMDWLFGHCQLPARSTGVGRTGGARTRTASRAAEPERGRPRKKCRRPPGNEGTCTWEISRCAWHRQMRLASPGAPDAYVISQGAPEWQIFNHWCLSGPSPPPWAHHGPLPCAAHR
jgi:hypothetical protein